VDELFQVLNPSIVQKRAERAVPLHRSTLPRPGDVFDYVARVVWDAPEANRERAFLDLMRRYLQTESAGERWKKLHAVANAYGADFKTLVRYLRANGIPTAHRAPAKAKG
jgi:hypothetical protein